jgi:anaerobic magnesium-protoporphyrin IX monomethyl ester cyclase
LSRILFVNPPLGAAKRYGALAQAGGKAYPFGLCYLAAATRTHGFDTLILDADVLNLRYDQALSSILDSDPDYIGFTATTSAISTASQLALSVKNVNPSIVTFIGGSHVCALPEITLLENPGFDFAVIGEGEHTVVEALQNLKQNNDLTTVKGLALRKANNVFFTGLRPRIKDLDSLGYPAFDLLPNLTKFYRVSTQSVCDLPSASLITSRGCLGRCTFCDRSVFSNQVTFHSADYMVNLIGKLKKKYAIKCILFEDDNFMAFKPRLKRFVELLKSNKTKISWSALSRIDTIDQESLELAREGGCWQIQYGIESGSQKILDFMQKGILVNQVEKVLELTKKTGIEIKGFFMLGNPLEDESSIEETRRLVMKSSLSDIALTFFTPYPGSAIYNNINAHGTLRPKWDDMTSYNVVFIPKGMTGQGLISSQKEILKSFYSRPKIFLSYLTRAKSLRALIELFVSGFVLLKYLFLNGKNNFKCR